MGGDYSQVNLLNVERDSIELCVVRARKCGGSRYNFVDISSRSRYTTTSGLTASTLIPGRHMTSGNVASPLNQPLPKMR